MASSTQTPYGHVASFDKVANIDAYNAGDLPDVTAERTRWLADVLERLHHAGVGNITCRLNEAAAGSTLMLVTAQVFYEYRGMPVLQLDGTPVEGWPN